MPEILEYKNEHASSWDEYVRQHPQSTLAHLIGWRTVISGALGHKPHYLLAVDNASVVGVLPLFITTTWWRTRYAVSSPWIDYGGVLADNDTVEKLLIDEARRVTQDVGAQFLELRSITAGACDLAHRTDKVTFQLPLDPDPEVMWKGLHYKLRNHIRKSEKSGLNTEFGGSELIDPFYTIFCHNMRDLGTPVWGKSLFESILKTFPDSASIVLVRAKSGPIAGGLVLTYKDVAYVPSASSYRWARNTCPNHALYWNAIKRACLEGFTRFDFGRSSWDSNTFRFKKQWMPEPTQLTWQYYLNKIDAVPKINPANPKYRMFIGMWRKLPVGLANFLGPKVIRNFP